jgi:hypothetical protein
MNDVEFVAAGSPRVVSRAIEACADEQRMVSALVVPWESHPEVLSMAVTSAKVDGWAIEHTNLGTIRLTDLGNQRTGVLVRADQSSRTGEQKLARLFDEFARELQTRFQVAP